MTDHRPQLYDDIKDGKIKIEDLAAEQLEDLLKDFTLDYNPEFAFWEMVGKFLYLKRKAKKKEFDRGFFK